MANNEATTTSEIEKIISKAKRSGTFDFIIANEISHLLGQSDRLPDNLMALGQDRVATNLRNTLQRLADSVDAWEALED